ncbi:MAG: hypothetical protein HRU29_15335 [Rhizobiales bacterium]|nr:hypothetical protein [Hyphomicrobiales bacterium]NRB15769.1 hypothetical protein [Hyphomicrobiales bacterium]
MCDVGLITISERIRYNGSQSSNEYKLNIEFESGFTPCSINAQRCSAIAQSDVTDVQGAVQKSERGSVQQTEQLGVQLNEHQEPSLEPSFKPLYEPPLQKAKKTRFVAPTIDECETFFFDEKHITDQTMPSQFWDYYQSNGWIVGRTKMKDWRAAANGWVGRQKKYELSNRNQLQKPKPLIQQMADKLRAAEQTNSEMMEISYDK